MTRDEAGYTYVELVVAAIIIGILILLVMPSLAGYNNNAQVRQLAAQALTQYREIEGMSVAEGQPVGWGVFGNCTRPCSESWQGTTGGAQVFSTTVPAPLDLTGCYRDNFEPNGTLAVAGPCESNGAAWVNGALIVACVDNGSAASPFALELTVVPGTGQVVVTQLTTLCPVI